MYGLIGKMLAVPGQRDALMASLLEDVGELPGCRSFVVAADPDFPVPEIAHDRVFSGAERLV